jgi:hypothetical protein
MFRATKGPLQTLSRNTSAWFTPWPRGKWRSAPGGGSGPVGVHHLFTQSEQALLQRLGLRLAGANDPVCLPGCHQVAPTPPAERAGLRGQPRTQFATENRPNAIEAMLDEALLALPAAEQAGVMAHFYEGKNFKGNWRYAGHQRGWGPETGLPQPGQVAGFSVQTRRQSPHDRRGRIVDCAVCARNRSPGSFLRPPWLFAAQGKLAEGNALALANRAARLLGRRSAIGISLKLALAGILVIGGSGLGDKGVSHRSTVQVSDPRIEALAKDGA